MLETELLRKIVPEGPIQLYREGQETEHLMETSKLRDFLSKTKIQNAVIFGEPGAPEKTWSFIFEGNKIYVEIEQSTIENVPYIKDNSGCFMPILEKSVPVPKMGEYDRCIVVYSRSPIEILVPETDVYVWNDEEYELGKIGKYILATILSKRYDSIILANEEVNFEMSVKEIDNLFKFSKQNPEYIGCQKGFNFCDGFFNRKKQLSNKKCEYTHSNLSIYPSNVFIDFMKWYCKMNISIRGTEDLLFCTWCKINDVQIHTVQNSGTIFTSQERSPIASASKEIEELYKNTWCTINSRILPLSTKDTQISKIFYICKLTNPRMKRVKELTEKDQNIKLVYDPNIIWTEVQEYMKDFIQEYIYKSDKWCSREHITINDNDMVKICTVKGDEIQISNSYSGIKYKVSKDIGVSIEHVKSEDLSFNYNPETSIGKGTTAELFKEEPCPLVIIFGRENFDFYYDLINWENSCHFSLLFMKEYSGSKDYYLTLLEQNLDYLRKKIKESNATRVITLGIEEGGFSCVLYAKLLNLDKAISVSPKFPSRESVNKSRRKYLNLNKVMGSCKEIVTDSKEILGKNVKKISQLDNFEDIILHVI